MDDAERSKVVEGMLVMHAAGPAMVRAAAEFEEALAKVSAVLNKPTEDAADNVIRLRRARKP